MPNSKKAGNYSAGAAGAASFPRAIRDSGGASAGSIQSGAPARIVAQALGGFVSLVGMHAVLLWLAVRVLRSAGAVTWSLGAWHALALAFFYVWWKALGAYVFGRMHSD